MPDSAPDLRERRIAAISARLTAVARRWTAERGLGDFTVDELCAEIGVSRRTFFNWFATKEDAVLGITVRVDHTEIEGRFLAGATGRAPSGLSTTLLDDLAELMITRWEQLGLAADDVAALSAAMETTPKLLGRALVHTRQLERTDVALVEQREGLAPGDLRAATGVHLLGSVIRASIEERFSSDGAEPLRTVFARHLAAARSLFAS